MLKRLFTLGLVLAVGGGLAGCYVEDDEPGGGGGTVIDRERVIERDSEPDTHIQVNPPDDLEPDTKVETKRRTTTTD